MNDGAMNCMTYDTKWNGGYGIDVGACFLCFSFFFGFRPLNL